MHAPSVVKIGLFIMPLAAGLRAVAHNRPCSNRASQWGHLQRIKPQPLAPWFRQFPNPTSLPAGACFAAPPVGKLRAPGTHIVRVIKHQARLSLSSRPSLHAVSPGFASSSDVRNRHRLPSRVSWGQYVTCEALLTLWSSLPIAAHKPKS